MGLVLKGVSKNFGSKKAVDNISITMDKPGVYRTFRNKRSRKNYYDKNDFRNSRKGYW